MLRVTHHIIATCLIVLSTAFSAEERKPNVIIIFTDDLGYGDLGCYGSETIKTPHLDTMAAEGRRFTNFMVASSVCTPSRAALLTGCYPKRVGLEQHVLFPSSKKGLNPEEFTLGDLFQSQGYATACIGKWHLGHHPETLPRQHGFDQYYGIPYSNDMNHPDNKGKPMTGTKGMDILWVDPESTLTKWKTPLIENEEIIEMPVDQRTITRRYTDRALQFIQENKETPFFLYLPHSMPHIPLYVPDDLYDADPKKAYIKVIEHIDAEVGRIRETLKELKLEEHTYVIFTSDNGPWLKYNHHGGSAGPLRAGKSTPFEGGQRVPCVMWAPSNIPAGTVSDKLFTAMDVLPTLASLIKAPLPTDKKIDGKNALPLMLENGSVSPREEFLYYSSRGKLNGIRKGPWKLLRPSSKKSDGDSKGAYFLFNLEEDLSEQKDFSEQHPERVAELTALMKELDAEISQNTRPAWKK